jgi:hypothetical protein
VSLNNCIGSNFSLLSSDVSIISNARFNANTTGQLAERNKRITNDLTDSIADLNQTAGTKPTPTQDVIKGKVDRINALLQEAITVRVEKNQSTNSTVKSQAVSDIVDEVLERYREAYGIEE